MRRAAVLIVGCGSLGGSLAALLASAADVVIHDRGDATCRAVARRGIRLKEGSRICWARVGVAGSPEELDGRIFDLVILATKVPGLMPAARELGKRVTALRVMFPQNGIFNEAAAGRCFPGAAVCRGVTTMACRESAPGRFLILHRGKFYVGGKGAAWVAGLFRRAGTQVRGHADPSGAVWSKLIFNSVMNLLPVITGRGYDILGDDAAVYARVLGAVQEGKRVAAAEGVRLAFDPRQMVKAIRDGRYGQLGHMGSTYADVVAGRETELRYMTTALIGHARRHRIAVPVLTGLQREFVRKAKEYHG